MCISLKILSYVNGLARFDCSEMAGICRQAGKDGYWLLNCLRLGKV